MNYTLLLCYVFFYCIQEYSRPTARASVSIKYFVYLIKLNGDTTTD